MSEEEKELNENKSVGETENNEETSDGEDVESESTSSEEDIEKRQEESTEENTQNWEQEFYQMSDKYLRITAEFENYKKRMIRENSERLKYYNGDLIKALLPSLDGLEHAIAHASKEESSKESMIEGLELVYKMAHGGISFPFG